MLGLGTQAQSQYKERKSTFFLAKSEFGSSALVSGNEYVLGGPGTWAWSGTMLQRSFGAANTSASTAGCASRRDSSDVKKDYFCSGLSHMKDSYGGTSIAILKNVKGRDRKRNKSDH